LLAIEGGLRRLEKALIEEGVSVREGGSGVCGVLQGILRGRVILVRMRKMVRVQVEATQSNFFRRANTGQSEA